ncbi:MAG: hypothetical protein ABW061_17005 [Polyangiaceae bacterium]
MTLLSELSPKARALMDAGRGAFDPTAADRARIQDALRVQLGAAVLPPEVTPVSATPFRPSLQLISGVVVGACVVGGALFFALRGAAPVATPPKAPAVPVVAVQPVAPAADLEAQAEGVAPPASAVPVAPAKPAARLAQDSLAEELSLLSRATSALHSGRAAEALRLLNEHARKFPNGVLSEERRAARVQALCLVGRTTEGRAELARLAPQSPAAARAKQVCGN